MRVKAIQDVTYATRDYKAGDEFDTEIDGHGTLLIHAGKVEEVKQDEMPDRRPNRYKRRDMRAEK